MLTITNEVIIEHINYLKKKIKMDLTVKAQLILNVLH